MQKMTRLSGWLTFFFALSVALGAAPEARAAEGALEANEQLVLDFYREVFAEGNIGAADLYLAADYVQHNPNVPQGLAGFKEAFRNFQPAPVQSEVQAVVAEDDLVFIWQELQGPDGVPAGFVDVFRIEDGKLAEHWDFMPTGRMP